MTEAEEKLREDAVVFVKSNMKSLVEKFTSTCPSSVTSIPISMFMAGSPGAGKTEISKEIVNIFPESGVVRIDPDEVRVLLPGYDGKNSSVFQQPSALVVDQLLNKCFEKNMRFILDGTFSNLERAKKNVSRALGRSRPVVIVYVFQKPEVAWEFVKIREMSDGRRITREQFIHGFFEAKNCVNLIKEEFGSKVDVWFVQKDIDGGVQKIRLNVDSLDGYLPKVYSKQDLEMLII